MKFSEYKYERINPDYFKEEFSKAKEIVEKSTDLDEVCGVIKHINDLKKDYETVSTLCSIRYSINTVDEFYTKEQDFMDEVSPLVEGYLNEFNKALVNSPILDKLKERYGDKFFKEIELSLKTFSEEIIPLLQEENKLCSAYSKLIASAKIPYDGKVLNLSQLGKYAESSDRSVRRDVEMLIGDFTKENEDKFDDLYDRLVHLRCEMARILGFPSYVELGYARLGRLDYDSKMVANYRKQIYEELVPLVTKMYEDQRERLGLDKLMNYDLAYEFKTGNPTPIGTPAELVKKASQMYHEMSKETGEFFDFMQEHELMDLVAKEGKTSGGYCTFIPNYDSPFIFSNFNGTSGDIDVLTHEAGHAFQVYSSRNMELLENLWPTLEACEIHSMSMEFFAWPWMKLFFEDQTEKRLFSHMAGTITFIPYGASVDEFQHEIYLNPNMSKDERKACWRRIEKKYCPWKIYTHPELEKGTRWFRQGHIFESPFYYIDYTLAQVCAQQFWIKDQENHEAAWSDYYKLCCLGGSKTFLNLVKDANLMNPFVDGTIHFVTLKLKAFLDSVDKEKIK